MSDLQWFFGQKRFKSRIYFVLSFVLFLWPRSWYLRSFAKFFLLSFGNRFFLFTFTSLNHFYFVFLFRIISTYWFLTLVFNRNCFFHGFVFWTWSLKPFIFLLYILFNIIFLSCITFTSGPMLFSRNLLFSSII